MKKERQAGIVVGIPAVYVSKLEELHRRTDFCGLLIGLGLEAYSRQIAQETRQGGRQDHSFPFIEEWGIASWETR